MTGSLIAKLAIWAVPVLFSIVVHEVAHGWMAHRLGDDTAMRMGRLTLNPLMHIDMMGTIILPFILIILGGPVFGWAKPVPFNPNNFYRHVNPRKGTLLVALAGPGSNLILAFVSSFVFVAVQKFFSASHPLLYIPLSQLALALTTINLVLACLNLVPVPPLDGSKILLGILPPKYDRYFFMLERYGFLIIVVLLASGALSGLIIGPVNFLFNLFFSIPRAILF